MKFVLVLALIASVAFAADHCSPYTTCQACISEPLCGWCSEDVVYPGNITGAQCAGFNANGSNPFVCNGIYSTDQCVQGYVCNQSSYTCELGTPGQGNTLAQCEATCINQGQVYLCNTTTHQCVQVPSTEPNNGSYAVCQALCANPSHHPSSSSPGPSPTPQSLYACNFTSGQCQQAPAGKGEALSVCEQQCSKTNTSYMCNTFLQKCIKLPPGVKGDTLAQCENACQVKPNPGPPSQLVGLWRGIEINNDYVVGEYDLSINATTVVFIGRFGGSSTIATIIGTPFHIPQSSDLEMWIDVTSGPGAGQTIKSISDQSGEAGPETTFMTTAMGAPGGDVPSSISSAMTTSTDAVFAFAKCLDQSCHFALPVGATPKKIQMEIPKAMAFEDHCSQYGDSCADCIAHQYCGWCSVNVTYQDGSQGTQCAGFNGVNGSSAFVCAGRYSTTQCNNGYICNTTNYQCQQTTPGNGFPQAECEALCHPTPPPSPPQNMYTCNLTTHQCIKCNQTHCPGEMPLGQCESSCTNPKPGPHGNLIGVWRGIRIQNGYQTGEVEAVFTNTSVTFYKAGAEQFTANITSLGADLMIMKIMSGTYQGWVQSAIYQSANQDNGMYMAITFAKGIMGQSPPGSYSQAMYTPGMEEYVYFKCNAEPCVFKTPQA